MKKIIFSRKGRIPLPRKVVVVPLSRREIIRGVLLRLILFFVIIVISWQMCRIFILPGWLIVLYTWGGACALFGPYTDKRTYFKFQGEDPRIIQRYFSLSKIWIISGIMVIIVALILSIYFI